MYTFLHSLNQYLDKPVAIFGSGVSGRGVANVLGSEQIIDVFGKKPIFRMFDERKEVGKSTLFNREQANDVGLVIYSPGFSKDHPWLKIAREADCLCLSELDFGGALWQLWGNDIIAITGTNGKSTLTTLITQALGAIGIRAVAAGNIGYSLCQAVGDCLKTHSVAVCEVSSYQAESLVYAKPSALLWTNFAQDHLDRYAKMEDYFRAKWRLVEVLGSKSFFCGLSVRDYAHDYGYLLPEWSKTVMPQAGPIGSIFEKGPQQENYSIASAYWISEGLPLKELEKTAIEFQPLSHRLQRILTHQDVEYWDDSKATNFASTIEAMRTFNKKIHWIGGGKSKGGDIDSFIESIKNSIHTAYLIGETADRLCQLLTQAGIPAKVYPTLEEVVIAAKNSVQPGDDVVLSPGFSSLDMFESYSHRGEVFKNACEKL